MNKNKFKVNFVTSRVYSFYDVLTNRNFESMSWEDGEGLFFEVEKDEDDPETFFYLKRELINGTPVGAVETTSFKKHDWPVYAAICAGTISKGGTIKANFYDPLTDLKESDEIKLVS